ncbi:MAG: DUF2789 domain-containing protein [Acidobacteria bacterium]|nr:DUF2789 domain-containing protein [Acidobacteriota bacterium]
MESHLPSMTLLFTQLGLPSEPAAIQRFIETHRPLEARLALHEAPFWTASQAEFLKEQLDQDADWAILIDKLDSGLRRVSS